MCEHSNFQFGGQFYHSKSWPTKENPSFKGAWSRHVTHYKFLVPLNISGMAKAK